MVSLKLVLSLAVLACLAAIAHAQSFGDDDLEAVFRSRRTAQGVMRGYAGISRGRNPLAFAGGYAAHTRYMPRYLARPSMVQEEEVEPEQDEQEEQPMEDEVEEPMEDDEEQEEPEQDEEEIEEPVPVAPVKAGRGRPSTDKPTRPQQPVSGEEGAGRGGVTAIASSVSHGPGASAKSQAIAYGARLSRGNYRSRW